MRIVARGGITVGRPHFRPFPELLLLVFSSKFSTCQSSSHRTTVPPLPRLLSTLTPRKQQESCVLVKATEEPPTRSSTLGTSGSGVVAGQQPRTVVARSQSLESASLSAGARRASAARKEQEIEYFIPCVLPVRGIQARLQPKHVFGRYPGSRESRKTDDPVCDRVNFCRRLSVENKALPGTTVPCAARLV